MHPMTLRQLQLAEMCRRAPLPVLDAFLRRLTVRPTRGTRTAYTIARRVRAARRSLPA